MQSAIHALSASTKGLWAGRIMSALLVLFLLFDGVARLVKTDSAVKLLAELGYPESKVVGIGIILLACTVVYAIPRTSILGAILLTGYFGGAVASRVRADDDVFTVIVPIVFGALVWGGLVLRDAQLGARLLGPGEAPGEHRTG